MMRKCLVLAFLLCTVLGQFDVAAQPGQDVTGTWAGLVAGHNGSKEERPVELKLVQDGQILTGSLAGSLGSASILLVDPFEITDGKIVGADLSFTIVFPGEALGQAGKKMKLLFQGNVVDDEIKIIRSSVLDQEFTVSTTTEAQPFSLRRK